MEWQKPLWVSCSNITENLCEITRKKSQIKQDTPIQIGKTILDFAKKRMLEFYFNFLDRFIDRKDFELLQMDTDSLYFGLSVDRCDLDGKDISLESLVKPNMVEEFEKVKHKWIVQCPCGDSKCSAKDCDKRVTGLFKLENSGHFAVALCSKTYSVVSGDMYGKTFVKFSSKGVPCKRLKANPMGDMHNVLKTGESMETTFVNMNLDKPSQRMVMIEKTRTGLCPKYLKRALDSDGIHTVPLGLILRGGVTPEGASAKKRRIDLSLVRQDKLSPTTLFSHT